MKTKNLLLLIATISCLNSFAQIPPYVPTVGLVGWWPFTGNANDLSGNGFNGTVNGATLTTDRFGNSNSAFSFNGQTVASTNNTVVQTDCYIQVSNFNAAFTNAITISAWIEYQNNNQNPYGGDPILHRRNSNTIDFDFGIAYHHYATHLGPIGQSVDTSFLAYSTWYNLISVYDGINITFYVNGQLKSQYSASGNMDNNWTDLFIGRYVYQGGQTHYFFYNGKIDDIGIWNRALTQSEITSLFNVPILGCFAGNSNIQKVQICHQNNTICVDQSAVSAHLAHGDYVGRCHANRESTEEADGISFSINPNPSSGKFIVEIKGMLKQVQHDISIYDMIGEKVFEQKSVSEKIEINLSNHPNGIYFVTVRDEKNNLMMRKVVKM